MTNPPRPYNIAPLQIVIELVLGKTCFLATVDTYRNYTDNDEANVKALALLHL